MNSTLEVYIKINKLFLPVPSFMFTLDQARQEILSFFVCVLRDITPLNLAILAFTVWKRFAVSLKIVLITLLCIKPHN